MARKRREEFRAKAEAARDDARSRGEGTAFAERQQKNGSGKVNIYFNRGSEDGEKHGDVAQTTHADGNRTYHYVRDADQTEYIDDSKPKP
jgi:hypothetical protein